MIRIAIATHKEYKMPDDPLYIPIMAAAASCAEVPEEYIRDDSGDNISTRNGLYGELSVLYWLWKHHKTELPDADFIGLCHYRRYFTLHDRRLRRALTETEADKLLADGLIVLPTARNYLIESNYSHYINAHHSADLDLTRDIISERCPAYLRAYDDRMNMREGHRFNMFIMPAADLDSYCTWLFDILFELERRLNYSNYKGRDRRVFGLVSERLLDVWMDANHKNYVEISYIMTEKEPLIIKGTAMLIRKLKGIVRAHSNRE